MQLLWEVKVHFILNSKKYLELYETLLEPVEPAVDLVQPRLLLIVLTQSRQNLYKKKISDYLGTLRNLRNQYTINIRVSKDDANIIIYYE